MSPVEIIFDNREKSLITSFENMYPDVPFKVGVLEVGDIHFRINGELKCIVERKTLDDLSASIMDHRWSEQKQRISVHDCKKVYIIEGMNKKNSKGIPYDNLVSAMWSTIIRDELYIFRSSNIQETALSVKLIYNKLEGTGRDKAIRDSDSAIVSQLSSNKKNLYTKDNIWTAQIACVPGVSFTLAKKITSEYKSFESLYTAYLQNNRDISFLCVIPKIGKKISKTIEEYMF